QNWRRASKSLPAALSIPHQCWKPYGTVSQPLNLPSKMLMAGTCPSNGFKISASESAQPVYPSKNYKKQLRYDSSYSPNAPQLGNLRPPSSRSVCKASPIPLATTTPGSTSPVPG